MTETPTNNGPRPAIQAKKPAHKPRKQIVKARNVQRAQNVVRHGLTRVSAETQPLDKGIKSP
jgi:hypothetical protein